MGNGARAERRGVGAGAAAALDEPSTPKLDGASVSRAGSRVIEGAAAPLGGGSTTPGKVAVPAWLAGVCFAG